MTVEGSQNAHKGFKRYSAEKLGRKSALATFVTSSGPSLYPQKTHGSHPM